jgi:hypothetical protein
LVARWWRVIRLIAAAVPRAPRTQGYSMIFLLAVFFYALGAYYVKLLEKVK